MTTIKSTQPTNISTLIVAYNKRPELVRLGDVADVQDSVEDVRNYRPGRMASRAC